MDYSAFYDLTYPQRGIWFLEQLYPGTSIGNIAATMKINQPLDYELMNQGVSLLLQKNEAFRLHFTVRDGKPVQFVTPWQPYRMPYYDFSKDGMQRLYDWDQEQTRKPFVLQDADLFDFALIKIDEGTTAFFARIHHLIADGWSLVRIASDIMTYYYQLQKKEPFAPEDNPSYLEFIASEQTYLQSDRLRQDRQFWQEYYREIPPPTSLKNKTVRNMSLKALRKSYNLPERLVQQIHDHCKLHGSSVFSLFFASLCIYINRVRDQEIITIGTPVLNRTNARQKKTIGMFVNMVPICLKVDDDLDFVAFSKQVDREWFAVLRHQKYPYDLLISDIKERDRQMIRLFELAISYQNGKIEKQDQEAAQVAHWHCSGYQVESLYLHINDRENDGTITLNYDYQAEAFYSREIEFIHDHVIRILWHALDNPSRKISCLHMLSEKERQKVLYTFNDTNAFWPQTATVAGLFERQAAARPKAVALTDGKISLTYAELNRQANRIAHRLIAAGAGPEDRIALMVRRSPQLIAAILGIVKAGAAYVPIDPDYPGQRIQYLLHDCGARILLTEANTAPLLFSGTLISLDEAVASSEDESLSENLPGRVRPENMLYVIYTSGSTGTPKGVMVEHRQVVRLLFNDRMPFSFGPDDSWTLFHSFCFDFSVWEMYGALLYGGRLVIVPKAEARDSTRFLRLLEQEQVTVLNQTPAAFYNLIHAIRQSGESRLKLKTVIFGGEALKPILLKPFRALFPDVHLVNMYGITETTVHVTWIDLSDEDIAKNIGNIGRPIPTSRVYILDKHQNPLPIGVAGEIYVGGAGVARGYLNRPDLTAARFLPDPFYPGEIMYRSGDLARLFPKGDLEYLGRIDHQVKIRGHRIELGEIESAILRDSHIREAAVIAGENLAGNRQLWAYYTADDALDLQELKTSLALRLPEYMMPACWIKLERIPLNANGKVNVRKLPIPSQEHYSGTEYAAPQNELQQEIIAIWQEILGLERIGIHDHFFELGGDSLSAVAAVTRLSRGITFAELYQYPTPLKLSEWIRKKERGAINNSSLLLKLTEKAEPALCHIICFPYGGGNGLIYRDLAEAISRRTQKCHVYSVNLPGHDLQPDSELWPIKETAVRLVNEIKTGINGEIILYGHCVGSALAVETARLLQQENIPVKTIYLGGSLPPVHSRLAGRNFDPWRMVPDRGIVHYLTQIGLDQAALPNNYLSSMIRSFRHDVRSYYRYFHEHKDGVAAKLKAPVVCIVGENDPMTANYTRRYTAWERYANTVKLQPLKEAKHYFIKSNVEELATLLTESG